MFKNVAAVMLAAAIVTGGFLPTGALALPVERAIVQQKFDASCGLAVISTYLGWIGRSVSEEQLLHRMTAFTPPTEEQKRISDAEGLSITDLERLIVDQNLVPVTRKRTISQIRRILAKEPLIIRIYISDDPSAPGHYSIAEESLPDGGFALADSIFGRFRLTEAELKKYLSRSDGKAVSIAIRTVDGRSPYLFPREASDSGLALPNLQARLMAFSTMPVEQGKTVFEIDLMKSISPRLTLFEADSIKVTNRNIAYAASATIRHGLTESTELSASVPFAMSKDSIQIDAAGTRLDENSSSRSFAKVVSLQIVTSTGPDEDPTIRYAANGSLTLPTDGRRFGIGVGIAASKSWDTAAISLTAGVSHQRAKLDDQIITLNSVQFGGMLIIPVRNNLQAMLSIHADRPNDNQIEATTTARASVSYQLDNRVTVAPYVTSERTGGRTSHSIGFSFAVTMPRTMF